MSELFNDLEQATEVFSSIVHEVTGPVIVTYSRAKWLLEKKDGVSKEDLAVILGLCSRTRSVLLNLGIVSSVTRGHDLRLSLVKVEPEYIVKEVLNTTAELLTLVAPNRDLRVEISRQSFHALMGAQVEIDPTLMDQAFWNVLDNAFKYSLSGTSVEVLARRRDSEGGTVAIEIINRGLPIEPDELEYCKQLWWRGRNAQYMLPAGMGLGLWVTTQILRAHRGDVKVASTSGITRISLLLPTLKD